MGYSGVAASHHVMPSVGQTGVKPLNIGLWGSGTAFSGVPTLQRLQVPCSTAQQRGLGLVKECQP